MGDLKKNRIDWLLMLAVALIPAIYAWSTWDHSGDRSLTPTRQFGFQAMLVELAVIGWAAARLKGLGPALRALGGKLTAAVIVVIFIAVLSAAMADRPMFATYKTIVNLIHLLFALSLTSLLSTYWRDARGAFLKLMLAGYCAYLLTVILYIVTAPQGFDWIFFGMTAQNIRNLGSHMMTVAAFACGLSFACNGKWRWAAMVTATVAFSLLFWSGSRGPLMGVMAAIAIGCVALDWRKATAFLGLSLSSGVLGAFLSFAYFHPDGRFGLWRTLGMSKATTGGDPSSGRWEMWMQTIDFLKVMPPWGYGDGQYFHVTRKVIGNFAFPHNLELQLLFQWGWIGGGLAILLICWLMWRAFWMTRQQPDIRLPGLMMLVAIFALGQLDGPFYDTLPMSFFAIAAAICLARKENPPPSLN